MEGTVRSIWRHPVKGFTPEALEEITLTAGQCFPFDRMFAVEDGPSGFDPAAPKHISKQKFTVLAKYAAVARIHTRFDDASGVLHATAPGQPAIAAPLYDQAGRDAFAAWLTRALGGETSNPLRMIPAPGAHRFMDDVLGYISIVNLASVRDLADKLGRPVDPRRFRANVYIDGWPAWAENEMSGRAFMIGDVEARVAKPIVRCVATHVDPDTGERDMELVRGLFENFGHQFCGLYAHVVRDGRVRLGDRAAFVAAPPAQTNIAATT